MAKAAERGLQLRLYVAGGAPNSLTALSNIRAICAEHFSSAHQIEIVDLLKNPGRASADGVIVTPTLINLSPLPKTRLIGSLSDTARVLLALSSTLSTRPGEAPPAVRHEERFATGLGMHVSI